MLCLLSTVHLTYISNSPSPYNWCFHGLLSSDESQEEDLKLLDATALCEAVAKTEGTSTLLKVLYNEEAQAREKSKSDVRRSKIRARKKGQHQQRIIRLSHPKRSLYDHGEF